MTQMERTQQTHGQGQGKDMFLMDNKCATSCTRNPQHHHTTTVLRPFFWDRLGEPMHHRPSGWAPLHTDSAVPTSTIPYPINPSIHRPRNPQQIEVMELEPYWLSVLPVAVFIGMQS